MTIGNAHDDERNMLNSEVVEGLRAQLEWLRLTHLQGLPEAAELEFTQASANVDDENIASENQTLQDPQAALDAIRADLGDCQRCKLHQGRNRIVYGQGNPQADLVFVGEGPGAEEDRQGVAFVGKAGELLTKMIKAMGYSREDVYICNIIKCRPPKNRDPQPEEVEACEPFLKAQLAVLQPKVIVAMGKYAAQTLLNSKTAISRLRGQWSSYEGIDLMPTFHPAYLLRNESAKRPVWNDLQAVMQHLDSPKNAEE